MPTTTNNGGNITFESAVVNDAPTISAIESAVNNTRNSVGAETLRAIGALHSCSDIVATNPRGRLVQMMRGAAAPAITTPQRLLPAAAGRKLVEVPASVAIRDVLEFLDRHQPDPWTLASIGNYTGQTFVGAVTTSTHGTMLDVGPISSCVRSVLIVDGMGRRRRIEPKRDPISNPASMAAAEPGVELIVDDALFDAVVVSLGSMGVIASVTIEAVSQFWLKQWRYNSTWEDYVRKLVLDGVRGDQSKPGENLVGWSAVVAAYPLDSGKHRAFVNCWYRSDTALPVTGTGCVFDQLGQFLSIKDAEMNWRLNPGCIRPDTNGMFDLLYPGANAESTNVAHAIMGTDYRGHPPRGFGAEFMVPYSHDASVAAAAERQDYVRLVDRVLASLWSQHGQNNWFGGWIALRFVKRFDAHMSMFHGRDSACVELLTLTVARNSTRTVKNVEQTVLSEFPGLRVHWGLANSMTQAQLRPDPASWDSARYPALPQWMAARRSLDPQGIFSNPMLARLGLE